MIKKKDYLYYTFLSESVVFGLSVVDNEIVEGDDGLGNKIQSSSWLLKEN